MRRSVVLTLSVAILASMAALPPSVEACGGFFCSRTPVDQQAERILFAVNEDTITTIVQISYQGKPEDFSWILPVPSVPIAESLDVFPQVGITALDLATGPIFIYPEDPCNPYIDEGEWTGATAAGTESGEEEGGVTIHQRQEVGPFDTVTISSEDPDALVSWLQENGYRITEPMIPVVRLYVEEKMFFFAMRLQPEKEVSDITPIVLEYMAKAPMIPLRLTAVAAEPEMSFVVWVLGAGRYVPENYGTITIGDDELIYDPERGTHNYFETVSRKVDEAGGRAFLTEYAHGTSEVIRQLENSYVPAEQQEAFDRLIALLQGYPYITRFYTRMSPEEMKEDPRFRFESEGSDVSNRFRLNLPPDYSCEGETGQESGDGLEAELERQCAFTYCGPTSACALTEEATGCICGEGFTARRVISPTGRLTVTCQDASLNFMTPEELSGEGGDFMNPCDGFSCGEHGVCLPLNGSPTCTCEEGYAAVARWLDVYEEKATIRCEKAIARQELPGDEEHPIEEITPDSGCGCTASESGDRLAGWLLFLNLLGLFLLRTFFRHQER